MSSTQAPRHTNVRVGGNSRTIQCVQGASAHECPCWREVPTVFQIVRMIVPGSCHSYAGVVRGLISGRPGIPFRAPRCKRRFPKLSSLVHYARIAHMHSFENPALFPLILRDWQRGRPADLGWLFERDKSEAPVAGLTGPFTKDFFSYTNTRACVGNGSSRTKTHLYAWRWEDLRMFP